jgi:hypothetical protein
MSELIEKITLAIQNNVTNRPLANICYEIAVQSQINMLLNCQIRLQTQWLSLEELKEEAPQSERNRLRAKQEGIMIAVENLRQDILQLELNLIEENNVTNI